MAMDKDIVARLREFMENEAKSYSMDFGCITPEYVYRMWGGTVKLEEIEEAMKEVKQLMKEIFICKSIIRFKEKYASQNKNT